VVGIPTPEMMRSEAVLQVWGPRAFGYDLPFVPFEIRFADHYRKHGVPEDKKQYLVS
jgi:hypothetical protein